MGAFTYSEEDGTPAADYQDQASFRRLALCNVRLKAFSLKIQFQVPQDVRQARKDELESLQQDIGMEFAESLVGRQVQDGISHPFLMILQSIL